MPHAGEVGAGDELDLVEDHEGEQEVVVEGAEDGHHHGGADGEAFFGAAEDDCDAVFSAEAEEFAAEVGGGVDDAEQDEAEEDEADEVPGVELGPVAAAGGAGEGGVDDEPDGALVVPSDEFAVAVDPLLEPALGDLSGDEGEEDLVADLQDGVEADGGA